MDTDLRPSRSSRPGEDPGSPARQALEAVPWLRTVPAETLESLASRAVLHRVPSGSLLFEQAEEPVFAQFLLAGSIALLGVRGTSETLVEFLRPVDLVIPAAVLNRRPYLLRARVHEEAQLLLVEAAAFRAAIVAHQALSLALLACLAAQFRRQVKQAKNVRLRGAEERVGCYLVSLLEGAGQGGMVRLPLEKHLIASRLGMTRETFSRCLSGMARHGLRIRGDLVQLEDAAAARARFSLDLLVDGPDAIEPLQEGGD